MPVKALKKRKGLCSETDPDLPLFFLKPLPRKKEVGLWTKMSFRKGYGVISCPDHLYIFLVEVDMKLLSVCIYCCIFPSCMYYNDTPAYPANRYPEKYGRTRKNDPAKDQPL